MGLLGGEIVVGDRLVLIHGGFAVIRTVVIDRFSLIVYVVAKH